LSDGTGKLIFLNPKSLTPSKYYTLQILVLRWANINESEFTKDLYANVWKANSIVKIDTSNGISNPGLGSLVLEPENKKSNAGVEWNCVDSITQIKFMLQKPMDNYL
jgi:glutamine cyclotransferase